MCVGGQPAGAGGVSTTAGVPGGQSERCNYGQELERGWEELATARGGENVRAGGAAGLCSHLWEWRRRHSVGPRAEGRTS